MNEVLEFETENGEIIYIEVDEGRRGVHRGRGESKNGGRIKEKFEAALSLVKTVGNSIVEQVKQIDAAPDEVSVELGVKFSVETGAIIAKTGTEGNIRLTLKWKREEARV
ncbi:MAG: CU044_2847 family protein [Bacteroidota bacterium]